MSPASLRIVEWLDKGRHAFVVVIVVGGVFLLGDTFAIMRSAQVVAPELGAVTGQVGQRPVPTFEMVTWWDYGRTAITFFAIAALAVMMLRSRAVSIFKEEIDAQRIRVDRLTREHDDAVRSAAIKDAELATLRGRTDLTRVLEMQQELLLMKREHDASMVAAITKISERGETQYTSAMETLTKTLNYLADAARQQDAVNKNHGDLLNRVVGLAESNWNANKRIEQAVHEHDDKHA